MGAEHEPGIHARRARVSAGGPQGVGGSTALGFGAFSASSDGSIAYRASSGERQLVWLDRSGHSVVTVGQPDDPNRLEPPVAGRPHRRCFRTVDGNSDAWLIDTARGVSRRLTPDPATDGELVFSPDGSRIGARPMARPMFMRCSSVVRWHRGCEPAVRIRREQVPARLVSRRPLHSLWEPELDDGSDLWALPLFGDRKPIEVARTPFKELEGRFSPDGRWVAYRSSETGRAEIYVQRFPGPGPKSQISVGGGGYPRWRRDGLRAVLSRARQATDGRGHRAARTDARRGAAALPVHDAEVPASQPSPDGRRFLVNTVVSDASPITVILNWKAPGR